MENLSSNQLSHLLNTGDLESFKKQSFVLKEGVEYRIKISFRVNREIVSGMKYIQHTYRKGVKSEWAGP